ncbi:MAG: branched-chain amino acid ABC transporter permease [Deltaproteobacteria bacterium]|nr:branched-chain amino acid ABC transporter permease [Deltaproteobacteria bacterium]
MSKFILKTRWYVLGILVLILATVPLWGSEYTLLFCLLFCLYLAMTQMWNLLTGYSGLLSLGQQTFIGLAGYTIAILVNYYGVYIWLSVLIGGIFAAFLALFMSLFIFRMKGMYFGIGTWIFAEAVLLWVSNWKYVKYGMGHFIKPDPAPSMIEIYYVAFVVGVGSVVLVYMLLRSKLGLGLIAMRDNDDVSETMGVEVFRSKLACFLIAAFVTGLAGAVMYTFQIFIQPYRCFAIDWTIKLVFIVIIGGIGTIEGPIVGSFIYVFLSQLLAEYISVNMLILGSIAIIVILVAPKGIMGTLQEKLGFEILSPRRK